MKLINWVEVAWGKQSVFWVMKQFTVSAKYAISKCFIWLTHLWWKARCDLQSSILQQKHGKFAHCPLHWLPALQGAVPAILAKGWAATSSIWGAGTSLCSSPKIWVQVLMSSLVPALGHLCRFKSQDNYLQLAHRKIQSWLWTRTHLVIPKPLPCSLGAAVGPGHIPP